MKKLIELLDKHEEIREEMEAIGCIDWIGGVNHFRLDELVKIIKDHDLEFTIEEFSERHPHIIKVVVGKHTLIAVATDMEFYRHFDSEGRLK
jgi:hypothetical protein